jgi:oxaloacetate decarboxylase (Na+ extruding) subunit alpha
MTEETRNKKRVEFYDTTMRDGAQSLWAMEMRHGTIDQVAHLLDEAGYSYIETPVNGMTAKHQVRWMKENPWDLAHLLGQKIKKTKKNQVLMECLDLLDYGEPRSVIRLYYQLAFKATGASRWFYMINTRNELDRHCPWLVPMARDEIGIEDFNPCICYYPSPRLTDEYYADVTKRLMTYKPHTFWLKDAGGLMTVERIKTLLPAIQKEARGIPINLHTHGMSTNQGRVVVEAMKLGVDGVHTCVPPLASGSSHISIFNAIHNAHVLGMEHNITNVAVLEEAERRLRKIGKIEGLPVGVPLEYDEGVYKHQVPGGVIANLREQLRQLHIPDKLDEVLDEVVRIVHDLGDPIMITPASQFIVSQAALNVAVGERYKEVLDSMIETALGVWGWEDAGVPWMDQNVKDRFLSHPNAKVLAAAYERKKETMASEGDLNKLRASYGLVNATDEEFMLYHIMKGDREIKQISKPYRSYFTGTEPLILLLKELSKDHDVSHLTMQRGDTFFEFKGGGKTVP